MYTGPNLVKTNLLFGYDTGYGVADNNTATRFYPGEPTINQVSDTPSNQGGWSGSFSLLDSATKSFQFNVSNFAANPGSGWRTFSWDMTSHAGSAVTISATIEVPDDSPGNLAWVMVGQLNTYTNSGGGGTYMGYSPASDRYQKSTKSTERISWSGTVGSGGGANQPNGHIGFTVWYNEGIPGTNSYIKVKDVQIELKSHATPFVNGTRGGEGANTLMNLSNKSGLDISNLSFNATGQPTFDGTGDYIDIATDFGTLDQYSFEYVENPQQTHKMPISSRLNTNFYKYGAYSWRYKHGGTLGEYYHTAGATSGWHHWVITYDGSTISVYQDNISLGTNSSSSGSADWSGGLKIGWWSAGGDYDFNGDIPVMKFYDRALTASEVASNFKAYKNRFNI